LYIQHTAKMTWIWQWATGYSAA